MSKKVKKNRTPTEQRRYYKRMKYLSFGGMFASIVLPFAIIGIVKFQDYFVEYNGTKMSIACVLAFALMGMAVWMVASKKVGNPLIAVLVGWYTVAFIFFLMGKVINDIAWIMFLGGIGLGGALGLDFVSKNFDAKMNEVDEAMKKAREEKTKEEYKKELEESEEKNKNDVKF